MHTPDKIKVALGDKEYAPDIGALRNLYNEGICMAYPEEIKTMLKNSF